MRSGSKQQVALRLLGPITRAGGAGGGLGGLPAPWVGRFAEISRAGPSFSSRTSAMVVGLWPSAAHCS